MTSVMKYMVHGALFNARLMLFAISIGLLSGCSTTSTVAENNSESFADIDEFYDGPSELIYSNKDSPDNAKDIIALGDTALAQGKLDEALYKYVKAVDLDNKSDTALYKIGDIHAKRGNIERAKKAYKMVFEINPGHGGAHESLGQLLLAERKYDKARNHLTKAEASGGDAISWRLYNSLGVISDLEKDYKQAIIYYQKALILQPELPLILNNMGYSRYMLGDWDSAENYYRMAVINDKYFERAWRNLGLLYVRKGNYEEAVSAFTQIENLHEAYNDVGFICMLDGKHDISEAFFKRAIKLSPRYYKAANNNLQKNRLLSNK